MIKHGVKESFTAVKDSLTGGHVCPRCRSAPTKVIYMGAPMKLCSDYACSTLWGFWSFVPVHVVPFNGVFLSYEQSYWRALWHWLTDWSDGDGGTAW